MKPLKDVYEFVSNTGSDIVTLFDCLIKGNTLLKNGDMLVLDFAYLSNNEAVSMAFTCWDGWSDGIIFGNSPNIATFKARFTIYKKDSTHAPCILEVIGSDGSAYVSPFGNGTIDLTNDAHLILTAQGTASGQVILMMSKLIFIPAAEA